MSRREENLRRAAQIADDLKRQIASGELKAGAKLMTERQQAEFYGVSVRVIRESLARLEAEGLISRVQGRGTMVRSQEAGVGRSRQKNIALFLIGQIRDTSTMEYFESFQSAFQRGGYGTVVFNTNNDKDEEVRLVRQVVEDGVAGLMVFSAHTSESYAHLEEAQQAGVPVALFDHDFPGLDCVFVGIDEVDAARRAAFHLINLGCDDLIYIDSDCEWTSVRRRRQGFLEVVTRHSTDVRGRLLHVNPFDNVEGQIKEKLPALLFDQKGRLGVIAFNDHAALQAMECIREAGFSVPEEVAVIGFADDLDGAISSNPLTTLQIPRTEIAQLGAYLLMYQIQNPQHKPQKIELTASLIIRSSCGCYPSLERKKV